MRPTFLAAILAVSWAWPALAQEKLSEKRFLDVLTPDHPALQAESDRLGTAGGDLRRARSLGNPILEFAREAPEDNPRVTNWSLSWIPPLDGRRSSRISAAGAGLRAAESDLADRRLRLRRELRETFALWALNMTRKSTIGSQMDMIERISFQMKARAEKGEDSPLAARRLELAVLEVRAQLIQAEAGFLKSEAAALAWWPTDPVAPFDPELPALPAVSDTLSAMDRPDLAALRHEVEQAHQLFRLGGRFLRFPEISLGWQRLHEFGETREGPLLGVAFNLPLFDRDQGDRHDARSRISVARARLEWMQNQSEAEVSGGIAAYNRLRNGALESMQAAEDASLVNESSAASFRLGESRLTDLLETLRSTLAARLAAIELYSAALAAHRDLETAVGRPLGPNGGSR